MKATIRTDDGTETEISRDEWQEVAEDVGAEIASLFASGWRSEALTITFAGYDAKEWEALGPELRDELAERAESD